MTAFVKPMQKEICCKNWEGLFYYIENMPQLPSGMDPDSAKEKLLEGLVGNPEYLIQDPDDPDRSYPVKESHLRDPRYWHSNEFSLKLFENAAQAIGGYRPLFQAGIIAGYRAFEKLQSRRLQFLRLLSPRICIGSVGRVNAKFNRTKNPEAVINTKGFAQVNLNYKKGIRISSHVCDWNAGIYAALGKYTGAHDIRVVETKCRTRGDESCVFDISWTHVNLYRRILIFIHSMFDPGYIRGRDLDNLMLHDLVARQEGIIRNKTEEIKAIHAQIFEEERKSIEAQLKRVSAELVDTEERERRNFAEALHDSVSQSVAISLLQVKQVIRTGSKKDGQQLANIRQSLETAISDIRSLTFQISPPVLKSLGFEASIKWLIDDMKRHHDIHFEFFNHIKRQIALEENVKIVLYRSVRELMINMVKHSKAANAQVTLSIFEGQLAVSVEDDGIGFDPEKIRKQKSSGFGLFSIQERVIALGGQMEISTLPGKGTCIMMMILLKQEVYS